MVGVTTMLVSVIELSNIFAVLIVLICFCAMVLFIMRNMMIFRIHGEDMVFGGSVHPVKPRIPQMKMMKVHIPFTFKLEEISKTTYSGDLQSISLMISSQVPYTLKAFWGVSIRELHLFLWKPWSIMKTHLEEGILLQEHCQKKGVVLNKSPHCEQVLSLALPQPALDLGTPPRLYYPLVIFLIRNDPKTLHPDETVALISVVHIKDLVCTLPTSILAQYLKQANGQLSCLKQLYLATGNSTGYEEEPVRDKDPNAAALLCTENDTAWSTTGIGSPEQLCVVCQYFPLSRALLPCRHTCICASCFNKLDRCPMCRSPIRSYFCIRGEEYMPIEPGAPASKPPPILQWFYNWNDHVIDFLGFQR